VGIAATRTNRTVHSPNETAPRSSTKSAPPYALVCPERPGPHADPAIEPDENRIATAIVSRPPSISRSQWQEGLRLSAGGRRSLGQGISSAGDHHGDGIENTSLWTLGASKAKETRFSLRQSLRRPSGTAGEFPRGRHGFVPRRWHQGFKFVGHLPMAIARGGVSGGRLAM